ncbi:MAG: cytidine deaminase [Bacteroidota bacterium]|nr:cytidine deaminase [Bacteroidota bacterium]
MKQEEIKIQYKKYRRDELDNDVLELLQHAEKSMKNAYAPYSKFHVGAAVKLANGKIITGNNQENAAYPSGLCAERVALFYANAEYPNIPVTDLIVVAESGSQGITEVPVSPCGSCRQVMQETESRYHKHMRVMLAGKEELWVFDNVSQLLPLNFTDDFFAE